MPSFTEVLMTPPELIHQKYAELRESGDGIHVDFDAGITLVTRHGDLKKIYRDSATYSNDLYWKNPMSAHDPGKPEQRRVVDHLQHFLLVLDPPAHTRLRNLTRHAFTPRAVAKMHSAIESASDEILAGLDDGQHVEFVSEVAEKLPVWVIAAAMGFPLQDRESLREWTLHINKTLDPAVQGQDRDRALAGSVGFIDYLEDLIAHRRENPGDDLISMLIEAQEGNDVLSSRELVTSILVLLAAGNLTTTSLLACGLKLLLDYPAQYSLLIDRPDLVTPAIEEMVRMEPPLRWNARIVAAAHQLGEHNLNTDTFLWLGVAAANRDPRAFDDPETFDVTRTDNPHVAFGQGAHYCIGAPLARLESAIFFPRLWKRFPAIRPLGPAHYAPMFIERAMTEFPVELA